MTYRPYPSAARARHQVERTGADADPADTHDWHNPTEYGLRCRRCDLSHKLWSGAPCPARLR